MQTDIELLKTMLAEQMIEAQKNNDKADKYYRMYMHTLRLYRDIIKERERLQKEMEYQRRQYADLSVL